MRDTDADLIPKGSRMAWPGLFLFAALLLAPVCSRAHRVSSVSLLAYLDSKERSYRLDLAMEVVPSEDPAENDRISPEDAAREFAGFLKILFDEKEQKPEMKIHLESTSDAETPPELRRQQVMTELKGPIPDGAGDFLLYLDPRCPMAVVMVAMVDGDLGARRMQVILSGEYSRPIPVGSIVEGDPFEAEQPPTAAKSAAASESGSDVAAAGRSPSPDGPSGSAPAPAAGGLRLGWRAFFRESLLPSFLAVGMLLLTLGRTSVLWQAGCLLGASGLVSVGAAFSLLPAPEWAAPVLALLVAAIALEALWHRHVRFWRYPLVLGAGAALGLFLAGTGAHRVLFATPETGPVDIVLFLLGTQSAFAAVVLGAASVLLPLSRFESYRKAIVAPLAVLIGGGSLFLTVERFL